MYRLLVVATTAVSLAVLLTDVASSPTTAVECSKNKSHNVFMGTKMFNDVLLYTNRIKKRGSLVWGYVSVDVDTGNLQKRIGYIEIIDGYTNGKGGCAFLTKGGVGSYRAAFHLKASQNRGGLDFTINVFGH